MEVGAPLGADRTKKMHLSFAQVHFFSSGRAECEPTNAATRRDTPQFVHVEKISFLEHLFAPVLLLQGF